MPDDSVRERPVALCDLIAEVRAEITRSQKAGLGSDQKFSLKEVELEVSFTASHEDKIGGGIKLAFVNVGGEDKAGSSHTNKIRLKLSPLEGETIPLTGADVSPEAAAGDVNL